MRKQGADTCGMGRSRGEQLESRRKEEEDRKAAERAFADAWTLRLKELKQEEVSTIHQIIIILVRALTDLSFALKWLVVG